MSYLSENRRIMREIRENHERNAHYQEIERRRIQSENARLAYRYSALLENTIIPMTHDSANAHWPRLEGINARQYYPTWGSHPARLQDHTRTDIIAKILAMSQHELDEENAKKNPTTDDKNDPSDSKILIAKARLISLLLGPKIAKAQAQALERFLNPEWQAYRSLYLTVKAYLQQTQWSDAERKVMAIERIQPHPTLKTMLTAVADDFARAFPSLQEKLETEVSRHFHGALLMENPLYLLEYWEDRAFTSIFNNTVFSLDEMETISIQREREKYQQALLPYLVNKNILTHFQKVTGKKEASEVIQAMLDLPAILPLTASAHFLPTLTQSDEIVAFIQHGADVADVNFSAISNPLSQWTILQEAITCFQAQHPYDALLANHLIQYSHIPHAQDHWRAIALGLRDAKQTACPLSEALLTYTTLPFFSTVRKGYVFQSRLNALVKRHAFSATPFSGQRLVHIHALAAKKPRNVRGRTDILPEFLSQWPDFFSHHSEAQQSLQVTGSWSHHHQNNVAVKLYALYPHLHSIESLSFQSTQLNDEAWYLLTQKQGWFFSCVQTISSLDISANPLTDQGLAQFIRQLPRWKALRSLDLSYTLITDKGIQQLIDVLHDTALTNVYCHHLILPEKMQDRLGAQLALNAEKNLPLPTPATIIPDETTEQILLETLLEHIKAEESVEERLWQDMENLTQRDDLKHAENVDLSSAALNDQDLPLERLLAYLRYRDKNLRSLSLAGHSFKQVSRESFVELIEALNRFPSLIFLNLSSTQLGTSEEGQPTAAATEANAPSRLVILIKNINLAQLDCLDLTGNHFSDNDFSLIRKVKDHNCTILFENLEINDEEDIFFLTNSETQTQPDLSTEISDESTPQPETTPEENTPSTVISLPIQTRERWLNAHDFSPRLQASSNDTWFYPLAIESDSVIFKISSQGAPLMAQMKTYRLRHYPRSQDYVMTLTRAIKTMFTSAKVSVGGDLVLNPGILRQMADVAFFPVVVLSTAVATVAQSLVSLQDEKERLTFLQKIVDFQHIVGDAQEESFALQLAEFIAAQYIFYARGNDLTDTQASNDLEHIKNWIGYVHFSKDPLVVTRHILSHETAHRYAFELKRVHLLVKMILVDASRLVFSVPHEHILTGQEIASTPRVSLIHPQYTHETSIRSSHFTTEGLPIIDAPFLPMPKEVYEESVAMKNPEAQKMLVFIRDIFILSQKEYQETNFYGRGYYEKFLMPLITRHGGIVSVSDCRLLGEMATQYPAQKFLTEAVEFLNKQATDSGLYEHSLLTLVLNHLLEPFRALPRAKEKNLSVARFFMTTARQKRLDDLQQAREVLEAIKHHAEHTPTLAMGGK